MSYFSWALHSILSYKQMINTDSTFSFLVVQENEVDAA